ncbi:hypothetical protein [Thermosediminibacter oceani]|uniref:Zinc-finger domain-containing protein n=1 Tax=Thermosediminibacter oceani (strain ATCC BAA-1034 / DSM 16646 / JW/IW-1228P) TaxID=555079 RepID=D9S149_THEOJ|nr:hypothetical protein [Thermosediminibacter oceani]ADL08928.1 conserved hypothetical protein [Thermosediminibacter oceani DSM 16646]
MRHYSKEEWMLFKNGCGTPEKLRNMEEHLYRCDCCLELFLSEIGDDEMRDASRKISPDFDKKVLAAAKKEFLEFGRKRVLRTPGFNKLIAYYTACAMITIMLMTAGLSLKVAEKLGMLANTAWGNRIEQGVSLNWPTKVAKKANEWIINFETGKGGFGIE